MKQAERKRKSIEEIYQAALCEFAKKGYENTNIENICKEHHISKGMMYHYFHSKDELFMLCVKRIFNDLEDYLKMTIPSIRQDDFLQAIRTYLLKREDYFKDHPEQRKVFEKALFNAPTKLKDEIIKARHSLKELNRQFILSSLDRLELKKGIDKEKALKYFDVIDYKFKDMLLLYVDKNEELDLVDAFDSYGELLDMFVFGIANK